MEKRLSRIKFRYLIWVLEALMSRGFWPLAKIKKVYNGSDPIFKSVNLKTAFGENLRPVVK